MNIAKTVDHFSYEIMQKYGISFLRYSLALVFIWFGFLKVIGISPAQELVTQTVTWFDPTWFVPFLGIWEVVIGLCFLTKSLMRVGLVLMAFQMVGAFLPLVLLPSIVYTQFPYGLTLEGQYIIKNLVLVGGAMVVGTQVLRNKQQKR